MTLINPREEFFKRVKKMKFVEEITTLDQYIDKYVVKVGNEYMTKTTFNNLLNKVDLILKNQELIVKLLSRENKEFSTPRICPEVSKALFKKNITTGDYLKVAFITGEGVITFLAKNDKVINNPSYYKSAWYYINEVGVTRYSTIDTPSGVTQIYVENSVNEGDYYVTGYLTNDGRAIYYDQYL